MRLSTLKDQSYEAKLQEKLQYLKEKEKLIYKEIKKVELQSHYQEKNLVKISKKQKKSKVIRNVNDANVELDR